MNWSPYKQCACSRYFSADDAHHDCQRCRNERYELTFRRRVRRQIKAIALATGAPYKRARNEDRV